MHERELQPADAGTSSVPIVSCNAGEIMSGVSIAGCQLSSHHAPLQFNRQIEKFSTAANVTQSR
jgi:hypothetical protein